jgi:hypothetical protein
MHTVPVSIPGLDLQFGERIIAHERPGLMKWTLVITMGLTVVLLPFALYYLLVRSGKAYVLTNRRVIRVNGPGKLEQIPLSDLDKYVFASDFFVRNTSLVFVPRAGTPHRKVRFALLTPTPDASMVRMWGALNMWVLSSWVTPDEAPPVDAKGKPVVGPPAVDVALLDDTFIASGLRMMPSRGAAVMTPHRLVFIRSEPISSGMGKLYPKLPMHAYLAVKAASIADPIAFEACLDWVLAQPDLTHVCIPWRECTKLTIGRFRGLNLEHDGKKLGLTLTKQNIEPVTAYCRRHSLLTDTPAPHAAM